MSYNSPFTIKFEDIEPSDFLAEATKKIGENVGYALDQMTFSALRKCSVEINEEELIRALNYDREQYQQGYEDGVRDGMEADRWIPVTERLPEDGQSVLTYKNGICEVQTYETRRNGWVSGRCFWSMAFVTHWMPLPDAPKDGDT